MSIGNSIFTRRRAFGHVGITGQVNFGLVGTAAARTMYVAVGAQAEPPLVFAPQAGRSIGVYSLHDGEKVMQLTGHYDTPICMACCPLREVLGQGSQR